MDKKKIIYIALLFIVIVLISVTYFSYAFFTGVSEQSGKLHIVVGTLNYDLTSSDLNSNKSITIAANESKKIEITISSLNDISSKYQLYYVSSSDNFDIGYSSTTTNQPSGTIAANGTKKITVSIKNNNNSAITIRFGIGASLPNNNVSLTEGIAINTEYDYRTCTYPDGKEWTFSYTGSSQTFSVPCNGVYKLEVWGAQGGSYNSTYYGGKGGYSYGSINLSSSTTLYVYAGGQGTGITSGTSGGSGGWNGGASGATGRNSSYGLGGSGGGGASDIRINSTSLYARVIVAGGGGGSGGPSMCGGSSLNPSSTITTGGSGGGTSGLTASYVACNGTLGGRPGNGGSATSGGSGGTSSKTNTTSTDRTYYPGGGAGGGGGWYGGGGGSGGSANNSSLSTGSSGSSGSFGSGGSGGAAGTSGTAYHSGGGGSGGGGSGYVYTSSTASNYPSGCQLNSSYYLTSANTYDGSVSFTGTSGSSETGHSGNGYARITLVTATGGNENNCSTAVNTVWNYAYTGTYKTFTAPCAGRYKLEVWGAAGGTSTAAGGKGGYSVGTINITSSNISSNFYIYVGGAGGSYSSSQSQGGYNGGGGSGFGSSGHATGTGGGASDIRIGSTSLYARVIVAGGGGGGGGDSANSSAVGGAGGGLQGINGVHTNGNIGSSTYSSTAGGSGGTQTSQGYGSTRDASTTGAFGQGGWGYPVSSSSGGGGGGWYGGGGGDCAGGGGGSGYVYTSSTYSNYPSGCLLNSNYYLTNASTIAGNQSFTAPGGGTETGHSGNGYARITYLGN